MKRSTIVERFIETEKPSQECVKHLPERSVNYVVELDITSRELKALFVATKRRANGPPRCGIRNAVSLETEGPIRKHAGWQSLQPVFQ